MGEIITVSYTHLDVYKRQASFTARDDTVTRAVMRLPPRLREAVLLHWYQGLSGEETAAVLRISRSAVFNLSLIHI